MSLWLQSTLMALEAGDYGRLRTQLLPSAPTKIPSCLYKEFEFGERFCRDLTKDRLFPVRFLWLMDGHEQRHFGIPPSRYRYHPEKLLEVWQDIIANPSHRQDLEAKGFRFELQEKALELTAGWIIIGDSFVEDFVEVEATLGVELLLRLPHSDECQPAFQEIRRQRSRARQSPEGDPRQ